MLRSKGVWLIPVEDVSNLHIYFPLSFFSDDLLIEGNMGGCANIIAAERHVSPFYTLACGPDTPLRIDGFPSVLESIPWPNAPMPCLDIMDLINFRAGSMFPGLPE